MTAAAWSFDIDRHQTWTRLLFACVLSLLLHLILLLGVPVNPTGGVPGVNSIITVQLAPAPDAAVGRPDTGGIVAEPSPKVEPLQPHGGPKATVSKPPASPSSGIDVPLIRDAVYYSAKELDVYPQPLAPVVLRYPAAALEKRLNGHLVLLLLIDEFGVVNEVSVVSAEPPGYFEDAARAAFSAARFMPAQRQGHAVKSRMQIQADYDYQTQQNDIR